MRTSAKEPDLRIYVEDGCFEGCESWYDIAAVCYLEAFDGAAIEANLCAGYFEAEETAKNPNFALLHNLCEDVRGRALKTWHLVGIEPSGTTQWLASRLKEITLEPFGLDDENVASVFFAVLRGIDRACQEASYAKTASRKGPLNRLFADRISVFYKADSCMVESIMKEKGRERCPEMTVNDQLMALQFRTLGEGDPCRPVIVEAPKPAYAHGYKTSIKIGLCAFSRSPMVGLGSGNMPIEMLVDQGRLFTVSYVDGYDQTYADGVVAAARRAIVEGCDILVYPEYVMSPGLIGKLQELLNESCGEHTVALIVAGSTRISGDNVATLLDCYGNSLGTCYKSRPYVARKQHEEHGASTEENTTRDEAWCFTRLDVDLVEKLEHPGAELTMVDIPDFGRVLVVVCKDMASDRLDVLGLIRDYGVQLTCCVAMSASVDTGFLDVASMAATRFLSAACICNLCGSRADKVESRGGIGMVVAPGIEVDEQTDWVRAGAPVVKRTRRSGNCPANGDCHGACLHVATIDYAGVNALGGAPEISIKGPLIDL